MASYNALTIQSCGAKTASFVYAELDANGFVAVDQFDHSQSKRYLANALRVYSKKAGDASFHRIISVRDAHVNVLVTDCRVVFRCDDYDNDVAEYTGGLVAKALNALAKRELKKRSSGKALVGHVRYEWIREVGYSLKNKDGKQAEDSFCIRVTYSDVENTRFLIEAAFTMGEDTAIIANTIIHKASRYRLAMKKGCSNKEFFEKYKTVNIEEKPDTEYYRLVFPDSFHAPDGEKCRPEVFEEEKIVKPQRTSVAANRLNAQMTSDTASAPKEEAKMRPGSSFKSSFGTAPIRSNDGAGRPKPASRPVTRPGARPATGSATRPGARPATGSNIAGKSAPKPSSAAATLPKAKESPKKSIDSEMKKIEILKQYKELFEAGVLTEAEFNDKKKELLGLD